MCASCQSSATSKELQGGPQYPCALCNVSCPPAQEGSSRCLPDLLSFYLLLLGMCLPIWPKSNDHSEKSCGKAGRWPGIVWGIEHLLIELISECSLQRVWRIERFVIVLQNVFQIRRSNDFSFKFEIDPSLMDPPAHLPRRFLSCLSSGCMSNARAR